MYPSLILIFAVFAGVLGWAIRENHGSAGNLVSPTVKLSKTQIGFAMMSGACGVAGSYTGSSIRISDWTRFAKRRSAPTVPMVLAMPVTFSISAICGILVTSATRERYGVLEWNPLLLLQYVQALDYTPKCRAATFFAGVAFLCSQLFVSRDGPSQILA